MTAAAASAAHSDQTLHCLQLQFSKNLFDDHTDTHTRSVGAVEFWSSDSAVARLFRGVTVMLTDFPNILATNSAHCFALKNYGENLPKSFVVSKTPS